MVGRTRVLEPAPWLDADEVAPPRERHHVWTAATGVEAVLACVIVAADLAIPSLVLVAMAALSLVVRRARWSSLGLRRWEVPWLVPKMLAFAAGWSAFQFVVTMPIANHLSGTTQDLGDFEDLEGDVRLLLTMVALGWVVGALLEEVAYRGYLQTRLRQGLGSSMLAVIVAVAVSSALFGRVHSEQGLVGIAVVSLDGVAWSVLRYRYATLWASVLAHGFNNTIGFVVFYVVGPVYGLW